MNVFFVVVSRGMLWRVLDGIDYIAINFKITSERRQIATETENITRKHARTIDEANLLAERCAVIEPN